MDLWLVGNGLDLHFNLPTNYNSFLRVSERLLHLLKEADEDDEWGVDKKDDSAVGEGKHRKRIESVARVLNDRSLIDSDRCLKNCIETYGSDYDASLDSDEIEKVFGRLDNNMWFNYLIRSVNPKERWIDFEREIGYVVSTLKEMLATSEDGELVYIQEDYMEHIYASFPFFLNAKVINNQVIKTRPTTSYSVSEDYKIEEPYGSGRFFIDKRKIASVLFEGLRELTDALHGYLKWFVERPLSAVLQKGDVKIDPLIASWAWTNTKIVSFNYTHTLEKMFQQSIDSRRIFYIHGEVDETREGVTNSGIVLGINADGYDELDDLDISFIQFKKYFQRVFYGTDLSYLSFMSIYEDWKKKENKDYSLYVMGHSLDVTDEEVIRECFMNAYRITVFYHNKSSLDDYVRNLVSIFGKTGFDSLRNGRRLRFIDLDTAMKYSQEEFEKKCLK